MSPAGSRRADPRSEALPKPASPSWPGLWAGLGDDAPPKHPPAGLPGGSKDPAAARLPQNLVGLTVMVVDDDDDSLDYFAMALRACGAVVLTASTAGDALRLVQERRPDVVLSDIAMVGQDGYWLVREIRGLADRVTGRIPIVATTAYGREHSRDRVLTAGFSEHLPKPVDPEVLCRTIARAAGR